MALKKDFYREIFENEQRWIELINNNLLNSIYCNLVLKPFYIQKRNEINQEYLITDNKILKQVLSIIDDILEKIEFFNIQYKNSKLVDLKLLLPLFLINQMNNVNYNKSKTEMSLDNLKKEKKALERQIRSLEKSDSLNSDYIYEDFPSDYKKIL